MCGTYHVYHVDKVLGIIPREIFNRLDLIMIQEGSRYQRVALMRGKCVAEQLFPGWNVTSRVTTRVKSNHQMDDHKNESDTDGVRTCKTSEASGRE
jgi:hypothetical protein